MGRTFAASALVSAATVAAVSACAPASPAPITSFAGSGRTGSSSPAAAYIASHPVPARPGMASGILTSWSVVSNGNGPAECNYGQCWRWRGTVIEAGGRTVQIGYQGFGYDCPGPVSWPPAGVPNGAPNDYIYFETTTSNLCPPTGVIIIKAAAIRAGG